MQQIYHCVQLNALFCCLWRNVEASCHKHFVVFSRNQHRRRLLPAMCHTQLAGRWPWSTGDRVDNTWPVASRQLSQIYAQNQEFCLPHLHSTPPLGGSRRNIAMPFGTDKLEWCGYRMVKKIEDILFVLTECTNVSDRHTHRMTA